MAAVEKLIGFIFRDEADRRVSDWLFMSSIWPTFYVVLVYLTSIYIFLPVFMKNRKPYKLKTTLRLYNLYQIAACVYLIYWILTSGWIQGKYSLGCQPVDYSNDSTAVGLLKAIYMTHYLKMTELLETIFFILRKKHGQVSKLHVYHHVSSLTSTWIACKYAGGAMASLPIMVNSFIHILMYFYYYLTSLGPKWQKKLVPWKPRLTLAQMVQFTLLIIHALPGLHPDCRISKSIFLFYLPNVVIIYKMFYDFYKVNYYKKNNKAE